MRSETVTISIKKAEEGKLAIWIDDRDTSLLWDYVEVRDIVDEVMKSYRTAIYPSIWPAPIREKKMSKAERLANRQRMDAIHAKIRAVVATGVCPQCGSAVKRNLSLEGWWQCEQYGSEQFRVRPSQPSCSWQGFTE